MSLQLTTTTMEGVEETGEVPPHAVMRHLEAEACKLGGKEGGIQKMKVSSSMEPGLCEWLRH